MSSVPVTVSFLPILSLPAITTFTILCTFNTNSNATNPLHCECKHFTACTEQSMKRNVRGYSKKRNSVQYVTLGCLPTCTVHYTYYEGVGKVITLCSFLTCNLPSLEYHSYSTLWSRLSSTLQHTQKQGHTLIRGNMPSQ